MNTIKDTLIIIGLVLVILIVTCGGWVTKSYFEMKAFNKFSDTKATLIDAMFSNLRVTPR